MTIREIEFTLKDGRKALLRSPRDEDIPGIQKVARFLLKDLRGIAGAVQITNEMGVDRFMNGRKSLV